MHACMQQQQQAPALDPCLLLSQQTDATPAVTILLLWQSVFVFLCLPCCCWRFRPQSAIYLRKALCVTCKYMYVCIRYGTSPGYFRCTAAPAPTEALFLPSCLAAAHLPLVVPLVPGPRLLPLQRCPAELLRLHHQVAWPENTGGCVHQ